MTDHPERFDAEAYANELADRRRRRDEQQPGPQPCPSHPEVNVPAGEFCPDCARENQAAARRARIRSINDECDTRFPTRYKAGHVEHPDIAEWTTRYANDPASCPSLLIVGPTGTGKTFQAYGTLRAALVAHPSPWAALPYPEMIAKLLPRTGADTEGVMTVYQTIPLLLVDDLGVAKHTEWVEEAIARIVGARYDAMLPAIYTTNIAPADLKDALGGRVASRLAETCVRVALKGADRRLAS